MLRTWNKCYRGRTWEHKGQITCIQIPLMRLYSQKLLTHSMSWSVIHKMGLLWLPLRLTRSINELLHENHLLYFWCTAKCSINARYSSLIFGKPRISWKCQLNLMIFVLNGRKLHHRTRCPVSTQNNTKGVPRKWAVTIHRYCENSSCWYSKLWILSFVEHFNRWSCQMCLHVSIVKTF